MEQEGDKYRANSGKQGGKIVTTDWSIAEPKNVGRANATTGEQQAAAEIESLYTKKKKIKYRENIDDIDTKTFVSPMLAKKFVDYESKIDFTKQQWGAQIKFNGGRCVITRHGMFSRKGERFMTCPHIEESFKEFFASFPDAVIDGELFNWDLRQELNSIMKLIRRTVNITPEDLEASKSKIKIYVYDGFNFGGVTTESDYSLRKAAVNEFVIPASPYAVAVATIPVQSRADLNAVYDDCIKNGQEGIILRRMNSPYKLGPSRSKDLLKLKPTDDKEVRIIKISEGIGDWAGKAKRIDVQDLDTDAVFGSTFKGSMAQAEEMLAHAEDYIGKIATITFNGYTGLGTPNNAQLDYDNWNNANK